MGGLRKETPITFLTLLCAAVAIAGVPSTSGCSQQGRDSARGASHASADVLDRRDHGGMTAFYVFRASSWPSSASLAAIIIRMNRRW